MLSYNEYTAINESVRSELFKNGMCVSYSKTGNSSEYYVYLCLTDKDEIKKALSDLIWNDSFSPSDEKNVIDEKNGILVTSRENGMDYVLISDIIVNNIMYIWDTGLKLKDCIKDKNIVDLKDKCTEDTLIYEKDVDIKNIVTLLPDQPSFNHGMNQDKWSAQYSVCGVNDRTGINRSIRIPYPTCL